MWRLAELLLIFSSGVFILKMTHKDLKEEAASTVKMTTNYVKNSINRNES